VTTLGRSENIFHYILCLFFLQNFQKYKIPVLNCVNLKCEVNKDSKLKICI
jgi:hypothetical protein